MDIHYRQCVCYHIYTDLTELWYQKFVSVPQISITTLTYFCIFTILTIAIVTKNGIGCLQLILELQNFKNTYGGHRHSWEQQRYEFLLQCHSLVRSVILCANIQ